MPVPGLVIVDDLPSGVFGESLWRNGILWKCEVQTVFSCKPGNLEIPVAGEDGDEPIIVKTHAAIWYMDIIYHLERIGSPPVVPDWELDDTNLVLLDMNFTAQAPTPYDDTLFMHKASGHYKFVMLKPPSKAAGNLKSAWNIYWQQAKAHYRTSNFSKNYTQY